MTVTLLNQLYNKFKVASLFHRYISFKHISPCLKNLEDQFEITVIGNSVLGEPIHVIKMGIGNQKILMWSQMHGNESTTTKAIFDLCSLFADSKSQLVNNILNTCTIAIIPMLNPDGARAYTRINANGVDLNRDAQKLSQPESKVLRSYFNSFKPDFCFNLHGQRTIFSAGKAKFPATISFLAPAQDANCTITNNRKTAMEIIVAMNKMLQLQIPNQVGVYDDSFNINCVGDTFQSFNIPTILFEVGHYANDYSREETRKYMFQSLLTAINHISCNVVIGKKYKKYFEIPENEKLYFDIIIRNALINSKLNDIGILYQEKLINEKVEFIPIIEIISDLKHFYGHREFNAQKKEALQGNLKELKVGIEIDFVLINNNNISLKLKNN